MLVSSPRWTLIGGSFTCNRRGTVHVLLDGPTHHVEYRVRVSIASPASLYASISSLLSFARCRLLSAIRSLSKPVRSLAYAIVAQRRAEIRKRWTLRLI